MYNCLKFCQRFLNPFTLETADNLIRHNGRTFSNRKIFSKHFNTVSSPITDGLLSNQHVSNFEELVLYLRNIRRPKVEQISQLFTAIKDDNLTENQALSLLEYCKNSKPSDDIKNTNDLCHSVVNKFQATGKFSEEVYKTYVNICTQNRQCLDAESLISFLKDNINPSLIKLILCNVCECGEPDKALQVLEKMKERKYPLDEDVFNYLILAHTIEGGLTAGLKILQTMKTAKFRESSSMPFFIIKGLAQRKDMEEFCDALERYKISYSEDMILLLLETLGLSGNHEWAKKILTLLDKSSLSRYFIMKLESLCINLVRTGKCDGAFEIYKIFMDVDPKSPSTYGKNILEEMLLCDVPIERITELAQDLKRSGVNEFALESVTESALRNKMFVKALHLFEHLSVLRPHYFWPFLIQSHLKQGEEGLLETVRIALNMNVKFDSESFQNLIFPRCDLKNSQRVLKMFQEIGYTVKALLTPMMVVLLRKTEFGSVLNLYDAYKDVKIEPDEVLKALSVSWLITNNHNACITVLEKIADSESEVLAGKFLIDILERMSNSSKMRSFISLLREYKRRTLLINSDTADTMLMIVNRKLQVPELMDDLNRSINDILDISKIPTTHTSVHPRNMSLEQLELQLIELKGKNMETRGVLRLLMQKYAGSGNPERVKELREELATRNYYLSPGMKSVIMHTHIQEGDLKEALDIYDELMESYPLFRTDSFKVIDLATLLVKRNRFEQAMEVLRRSARQKKFHEPTSTLNRNILHLLKSTQDMDQQNQLFKLLVDERYCEPSNIILGTIIQLHLEKDTIENTVELYVEMCQKYDKTPMQVVVLSEVLESGNEDLLHKVLEASALVHGTTSARCSLVAAMCEKSLSKQVATVLQDCQINPTIDLEKRCERWVATNNMSALQTLLAASKNIPPKLINVPKVKLSIMQLYSKRNDCDGALAFWKQLVDEDDHIDTEVDNEFCELLSRCKFSSPENLNMKYKLK